jgi:precorrin-6x reductase
MNENRISIEYTREELDVVNEAYRIIVAKIGPKLRALDPNDKRTMPKLGEKNIAHFEKCAQYAISNPEFVPPFMSAEEFNRDLNAYKASLILLRPFAQLSSNLDDTATLCGAEVREQGSAFYNSVKQAAKMGVPNAKAIYDDLKISFEAQRVKSKPAEEQPEA